MTNNRSISIFQVTNLGSILIFLSAFTFLINCGRGDSPNSISQANDSTAGSNHSDEIDFKTPTDDYSNAIIGSVSHILDGDTLIVEDKTGFKTVIRLAGIDAPEFNQPFGKDSKEVLRSLVEWKSVTMKTEKKDRYGRSVGTIFIDGKDIGLEMIRLGYAWHFKRYQDEQSARGRKLYANMEDTARSARRGLWKDNNPVSPWDFREMERQQEIIANSDNANH